jgi:two-component system chemotaxis response regulator CheY
MARVLIADDSMFMRKTLRDALSLGGHEVVGEAANGAEAIARHAELNPEITTLDITMPTMDGLAALERIMSADPSAKVLMCSALGQEHKVMQAITAGASGFVTKPFKADRLLDAIARAIA